MSNDKNKVEKANKKVTLEIVECHRMRGMILFYILFSCSGLASFAFVGVL
jgi:hypothetical protein